MATTAPPRKRKGKQQQLVGLLLYPLEWLEERSGLVG